MKICFHKIKIKRSFYFLYILFFNFPVICVLCLPCGETWFFNSTSMFKQQEVKATSLILIYANKTW